MPLLLFGKHSQQNMPHPCVGALIASCSQFVMKLNHVVAPLRSPKLDGGEKKIELAPLFACFPLRKLPFFHPALNRCVTHAKMIRYRLVGHPLLSEGKNLFIAGEAFFFPGFSNGGKRRQDFDRLFDGGSGPLCLTV